ncbi:hypothetical protein [Tenacibaculum sp. L6]
MKEINATAEAIADIDKRIDKLVKKIELLRYVNPVNIEEEKQRLKRF